MKAIIPVAGKGTRLQPITLTTPKPLIRILNKPILLWNIESLLKNDISEIILVISNNAFGKKIKNYIKKLSIKRANFKFIIQKEQLGTAHVLQQTKKIFKKDEDFIFINGDDIYGPENIKIFKQKGLFVLSKTVKDPEKWGILKSNKNNYLEEIIEKPKTDIGHNANINAFKLNSNIFDLYSKLRKTSRGEYEITDLVTLLAKSKKIKVVHIKDYWIPIGYPWHILDANEALIKNYKFKIEGKIEKNVIIHGSVSLPKSSIIKSNTYIEGNVIVGENTSIGPFTYFRDNVVIGNSCRIGLAVEIKNSCLGDNVKIARHCYIGDSIIGNNIEIGANSVTSNLRLDRKEVKTEIKQKPLGTMKRKFGAVIADGARIGVGTILYPGKKIWPNLMTLPGEIIVKDVKKDIDKRYFLNKIN